MSNPLRTAVRDHTFEAIAREVNGEFGSESLRFWQDTKNLRAGDQWRQQIHETLANCDFLVLLVSPSLLSSDVCREEFGAFISRFPGNASSGRVIPILLRPFQLNAKRTTPEARDFYTQLKTFHRDDWRSLEDLDAKEQSAEFRACALDIAAQIDRLDQIENTPQTPHPSAADATVNAEFVPVVSGYYERPGQSKHSVFANLAFSGPARITVGERSVTFSIRNSVLTTSVSGARIIDPNPDFGTGGWDGPNAKVQRLNANPYVDMLQITAREKWLRGEVLCPKGEGPLARLFDLETDNENPPAPKIVGKAKIDVEAVVIHNAKSDGTSNSETTKARLAKIVFDKLGLGTLNLGELSNE